MSYRVFARKYRPKTFDDVLGQDHVVRTLKNAVSQNRLAHAYLFVGPRGTGKTSLSRIFAKALNCTGGPRVDFDPNESVCVEIAEGRELFAQPRMPYTKMLLGAVPDLAMSGRARIAVTGEIPNPIDPPPGCAFHPRCPEVFAPCRNIAPALIDGVACHAVNGAPA